jgi:UDP-glucose:glycoprotein glucosyltransferase
MLEPQHIVKTSDTPKQIYDLCIWTALQAGFLWEAGLLADVEMNLALHSALPRIEAAYQYYRDHEAIRAGECESWVDWYGQVVCDAETLRSLLETETIDPSETIASNRCVFLISDAFLVS